MSPMISNSFFDSLRSLMALKLELVMTFTQLSSLLKALRDANMADIKVFPSPVPIYPIRPFFFSSTFE